jgi:phosphoribosyl 1,2-cyclic phosphate phosphodiesterase
VNSFLFLGTGASTGVPMITCHCAVCSSDDPHNKRLRPSGLFKLGKKRFLMDPGPDFRQQALKFGIEKLDGVLITHMHYDHVAGLDDLRVFHFLHHQILPFLLSKESHEEMKLCYHYLFKNFKADLIEKDFCTKKFEGHRWEIMSFVQAGMKVTGFRLGKFAYVMDLKEYTPELYEALKGVEVLVMSGLRYRPSPVHLTIDEAVLFAQKVGAKKTWFSHISHDLDHETTNQKLPDNIKLAFDGLEIPLHAD